MVPGDRYFDDTMTAGEGLRDHLDVPGEARFDEVGEDLGPQRPRRGLRAALGVGDARRHQQLRGAVERLSEPFSQRVFWRVPSRDVGRPRDPTASTP